jgi:hypothetical protein
MISISAPGYIPFEPSTDDQLDTRRRLRESLSGLRAGEGEILHATFVGGLPARSDVENALFYNVDARDVFGSMAQGVRFELDPTFIPGEVRYEYRTGPPEADFRHWRTGRDLAVLHTSFAGARPKLATIWWALRSTPDSIRPGVRALEPGEAFVMQLDVEGPAPALSPGLLKIVLDGTICALQSETDATLAVTTAPIIADALRVPTEAVLQALVDREPSALGTRRRFIHGHGPGVKWEPDDDRCVAAQILFRRAERWRIAGSVAVAEPAASSRAGTR